MGWYDGWRDKPFPTLYGENKTAVTEDILFIGFIYAACIIGLSFALVIPGYPEKEKLTQPIRIFLAIFISASIMLCNIGQDWEVAHIKDAPLPYKSGFRGEIHADVSVKIGLRSVNITLKGKPEEQKLLNNDSRSPVEKINYNERFSWNDEGWVQGRIGFGPAAGRVNREFREAQIKGTPYPILWVAEYFTLDGEGIRWGRFYRQSGYYTHILIWTALPLWIITCALFGMVIFYGGFFMILTGLVLLTANITYASIRNPNELKIPMADDKQLTFSWGWCFVLNLINGFLCTIIGVVVIVLHTIKDEWTFKFFAANRNNELEEIYAPKKRVEAEQLSLGHVSMAFNDEGVAEDIEEAYVGYDNNDEIFEDPVQANAEVQFVKRSFFSKKARNIISMHRPTPLPRSSRNAITEMARDLNEANAYENDSNEFKFDENDFKHSPIPKYRGLQKSSPKKLKNLEQKESQSPKNTSEQNTVQLEAKKPDNDTLTKIQSKSDTDQIPEPLVRPKRPARPARSEFHSTRDFAIPMDFQFDEEDQNDSSSVSDDRKCDAKL